MRALLILVVLSAALFTTDAEACSCQAPGAPCESMFFSTVFVGKAISTKEGDGVGVTTFEVQESLNAPGPLGTSVDVHHGTVGSMCGITFKLGERYVVYAGANSGVLSVGRCSRTHVFRAKDEDVAFARALPNRTTALVEGRLVRSEGHEKVPLGGVEVHAVDAGVSAKTTPTGTFTLALPPGLHTLELVSDAVVPWADRTTVVNVPHPAACAHPIISVQWNGRIEGTVTTADGAPVVGLEVFALAKNASDRHWRLSARTADDGTFLIHGAAPGAFFVAISPSDFGGTSPESPWPAMFAPGVSDVKKATVVKLSAAGKTGPVSFVVPKPQPTVTLRIVVKSADGNLVKGAFVSVAPTGGTRSTGGGTDALGVMTVKELASEPLTIRGCTADMKTCVTETKPFDKDTTVELVLPK
ncbi:MAG: hypothetical protein Q8L14_19360 [Myxococcales bacterium]|nr:hypothetical protein [Myxococcales bacterium]